MSTAWPEDANEDQIEALRVRAEQLMRMGPVKLVRRVIELEDAAREAYRVLGEGQTQADEIQASEKAMQILWRAGQPDVEVER